MGLIQTFKEAFKLRLGQLTNQSWLGKKVYYRGKLRLVLKETSTGIYLNGVPGPIDKNVLKNHCKVTWLGKKIMYKGKFRKVIKETSTGIYLLGISEMILKEYINDYLKATKKWQK